MEELLSDGLRLSAHFARPNGATRVPALLVLPGFPRGPGGAATVGNTDKTLCDRVARDAGWAGLTFTFRGTGPSEGDFSIEGWLADVRAAVDALLARADITGVWIAGFRLGGTLAIVTAADDDRVRGIATFSAPAVVAHVGAGSRLVPRVRASHGRAPDPRLSARPRGVDPRDRHPRSVGGRGSASRPGRGCSCTAAPTKWCPSTTPARLAERGRCRRRAAYRAQRRAPPAPRSPRHRRPARLDRPPRTLTVRPPGSLVGPCVAEPENPGSATCDRAAGFVEDGGEGVVEGVRGVSSRWRHAAWCCRRRGAAPRPVAEARDRFRCAARATNVPAIRLRLLRSLSRCPSTRCRPRRARRARRASGTRARRRARRSGRAPRRANPTVIVLAPLCSASATRRAKPGTKNAPVWPGPVWLNARTRTVSSPPPSHACSATNDAATLLTPYGESGRSGVSSSTRSRPASTRPYSSELPTTSTRAAPAARAASITCWVPSTLTRRNPAGSRHESATFDRAAR